MQDNASYHTPEEAAALAQRSETIIYPILLGEVRTRSEQAANLIASQTGGVPFFVNTGRALKDAFRSIRADLESTYIIAYRPGSQGPAAVKVRCTRRGTKIFAPERRY
jgi:hypothetical protein